TWRCECTGAHFIHVERWADPGPGGDMLVVEGFQPLFGLSDRLRAAWKVLFESRHSYVEVVLSGRTARQIAAALAGDRSPSDSE
ncbi:MAG TPA: hypothetical protein VFH45_10880, partial [Acidimicrobiales bacterium]|nr:hypothetical protein [Acidimicrobiales bacterium]